MISKIFSCCGWLEVLARRTLVKMPKLKSKLKRNRDSGKVGEGVKQLNESAWNEYKARVVAFAGKGNIILIHSSMDGLANIGVTPELFLKFILTLTDSENTIVLPAFPITNLKEPTPESRPYNPKCTPCWTGMLPNLFMATPGVIRSVFPFNSLAAIGPRAEVMMLDNDKARFVYGEHSAWKYCVDNHAKILFAGVSSLTSNTIAGHMVPDVLGDMWPIDEWYLTQTYKVKSDDGIYEHTIEVQDNVRWSQYCVDYATERKLEQNGLVKEEDIEGCCLGLVDDSKKMVDYLVAECEKGKLMFKIPKKFYKKK